MKKIARGKIRVKPSTLYCQYCAVFRKTEARDIKKKTRFCRISKKWISADDNGCKKFKPSKYFWCEEYGYWITLNECDTRREPDHPVYSKLSKMRCKNCDRQKFQVDRVIRFSEEHFAKAPKTKKLERRPKARKLKRSRQEPKPRQLKRTRGSTLEGWSKIILGDNPRKIKRHKKPKRTLKRRTK